MTKENKQKSTIECMLAIVKACNRIKKNLEANKAMIKAVSEMDKSIDYWKESKV